MKKFIIIFFLILLFPVFTFATTTEQTASTTIELLLTEYGTNTLLKLSEGEIVIITQLFVFYVTFLTFGLIYFLWGGKINKTGSQMFQQNTEEGKKTYYD